MSRHIKPFSVRPRHILLAILVAATLLRAALIASGVQDTPDDVRYLRALYIYNTRDVASLLLFGDHLGFTIISLIPAAFHRAAVLLTGIPLERLYAVPAFLLSLSSVACIGLLYGIARRAGGAQREALCVALLALLTTSLFSWTPYTLPYDVSMGLALWALYTGIHQRRTRILQRLFTVGLIVNIAFLTYNAHWILCGIVLVIVWCWPLLRLQRPSIVGTSPFRTLLLRGAALATGFMLPLLILILLSQGTYLTRLAQFSETVTQGAFSEGWSLPFEVWFHAEHALLIFWALGLFLSVWAFIRSIRLKQEEGVRRIGVWLCAAIGIYALLVIGSVFLERFVVYGRTARQVIPFILLAAGAGWAALPQFLQRNSTSSSQLTLITGKRLQNAFITVAALVALPNLIAPFMLDAPRDAELRARDLAGDEAIAIDFTVSGDYVNRYIETPAGAAYTLLNTRVIAFVTGVKLIPAGTMLFSMNNPLMYEPNLYEGAPPAERAILRQADLRMMLIQHLP